MVLVQGFAAYFIYNAATGIALSLPGFLAGVGLVYLFLVYYLALLLMLSTLFQSRGPVIGISLALVSFSYLTIMVPWLGRFMHASLVMRMGAGSPSLAESLALGLPLPTVAPIIGTALMVILFITVALVRFDRDEF